MCRGLFDSLSHKEAFINSKPCMRVAMLGQLAANPSRQSRRQGLLKPSMRAKDLNPSCGVQIGSRKIPVDQVLQKAVDVIGPAVLIV